MTTELPFAYTCGCGIRVTGREVWYSVGRVRRLVGFVIHGRRYEHRYNQRQPFICLSCGEWVDLWTAREASVREETNAAHTG